ncbi:MAG: hypothetical protein K2M66_04300, partial [Alistipes sp.]|nr:hypothetical protein [Alistipes sp.]
RGLGDVYTRQGERFDIHGGGMDLKFPHHECEIAQSTAALGHDSARYWLHNNMITINGQKMGKSLGNFITLEELFTGSHKLLTQAYSPMTIRFFVLQAHYRSTLDFSNEALQAAEKGLDRLMKGIETLDKIRPAESSTVNPAELEERCRAAMADDLNSPMVISALFDWVRIINQLADGKETIAAADLDALRATVRRYAFDILGLTDAKAAGAASGRDYVTPLVEMLLAERLQARAAKDWAASDRIRDGLAAAGIRVKDGKDGTDWELECMSEVKSAALALGTERIRKLLLQYAVPAIIAMTASSLYNMVDSIFIGHGVGPLAISGLALTFPLMNLAAAFGSLVGVGAATLISMRLGQRDYETAQHVLGNVV